MKKRMPRRRERTGKERKPSSSKTYNTIVERAGKRIGKAVNINEALFLDGKNLAEAQKIFAQICRELSGRPKKNLRYTMGSALAIENIWN